MKPTAFIAVVALMAAARERNDVLAWMIYRDIAIKLANETVRRTA